MVARAFLAAASAALSAISVAQAAPIITDQDFFAGVTSLVDETFVIGSITVEGFANFSADPLEPLAFRFNGTNDGVGLNGRVGGQIAANTAGPEAMKFTFGEAVDLGTLTLDRLRALDVGGERINEQARIEITTADDTKTVVLLTPSSETEADLTVDGAASGASVESVDNSERWTITFSDLPAFDDVVMLVLVSGESPGTGTAGSDFSFVSLESAPPSDDLPPVPLPAAGVLFGLGAAGFAFRRAKRGA